jgi:hypothetical protein
MCATALTVQAKSHVYEGSWGPGTGAPGEILTETSSCPLCGWHSTWEQDTHGYHNTPLSEATISELRSFELNSAELRMVELGTHLKAHSERLFDLTPSRFEELMTGIFGELGFHAIHTGRSGDGGADIVLFKDAHAPAWGIVECKRYLPSRRVKPEILRALVGAAVDFNVRRAYLVTTGTLTSGLYGKLEDFRAKGYDLDLVHATDILKMLEVYNERLPSLDKLSEAQRLEIIHRNTIDDVGVSGRGHG